MAAVQLQRVECVRGDLTLERVDAVVNAANPELAGGGGVDGALHRAAGPGLLAETRARYPEGCPTGEVRLTAGHGLPARHVIHAVGPVWRGGERGEAELLAACYTGALDLAGAEGFETVSFPAISCGVYGYPLPRAAEVAMAATAGALPRNRSVRLVRFVLFADEVLAHFEAARRAARLDSTEPSNTPTPGRHA